VCLFLHRWEPFSTLLPLPRQLKARSPAAAALVAHFRRRSKATGDGWRGGLVRPNNFKSRQQRHPTWSSQRIVHRGPRSGHRYHVLLRRKHPDRTRAERPSGRLGHTRRPWSHLRARAGDSQTVHPLLLNLVFGRYESRADPDDFLGARNNAADIQRGKEEEKEKLSSSDMKIPSEKHRDLASPSGTGNPFEHRVARAISACTRCRSRKSKVSCIRCDTGEPRQAAHPFDSHPKTVRRETSGMCEFGSHDSRLPCYASCYASC
jgi:hypothetical protein